MSSASVLAEIEAYPETFRTDYRQLVIDVADRVIPFGDDVTRRVALAGRSMEKFKADIAVYERRKAALQRRDDAAELKPEIDAANEKLRKATGALARFDRRVKEQRPKLQWNMAHALEDARRLEDRQRQAARDFWGEMQASSLPEYREQIEQLLRERSQLEAFLAQTQDAIHQEHRLVLDHIPDRESVIAENIKRKWADRRDELLTSIGRIDAKIRSLEAEANDPKNFRLAD